MLKPRPLNMEHPRPIQLLLGMAAADSSGVHPAVFEATNPDDIWQRQVVDDIGLKVFLDHKTARWYLVGLGVKDRTTTASSMAFEKKPKEAIIVYCPLEPGEVKVQEEKVARLRNYRPHGE
jgi:hypothetical protein